MERGRGRGGVRLRFRGGYEVLRTSSRLMLDEGRECGVGVSVSVSVACME